MCESVAHRIYSIRQNWNYSLRLTPRHSSPESVLDISLLTLSSSCRWSVGSVLFLLSWAVLMGPWSYAKHLISGPRLPFTAAYFGSIALTLYFAIGVRTTISRRSSSIHLHPPPSSVILHLDSLFPEWLHCTPGKGVSCIAYRLSCSRRDLPCHLPHSFDDISALATLSGTTWVDSNQGRRAGSVSSITPWTQRLRATTERQGDREERTQTRQILQSHTPKPQPKTVIQIYPSVLA